jgi:hypothetical protein
LCCVQAGGVQDPAADPQRGLDTDRGRAGSGAGQSSDVVPAPRPRRRCRRRDGYQYRAGRCGSCAQRTGELFGERADQVPSAAFLVRQQRRSERAVVRPGRQYRKTADHQPQRWPGRTAARAERRARPRTADADMREHQLDECRRHRRSSHDAHPARQRPPRRLRTAACGRHAGCGRLTSRRDLLEVHRVRAVGRATVRADPRAAALYPHRVAGRDRSDDVLGHRDAVRRRREVGDAAGRPA